MLTFCVASAKCARQLPVDQMGFLGDWKIITAKCLTDKRGEGGRPLGEDPFLPKQEGDDRAGGW